MTRQAVAVKGYLKLYDSRRIKPWVPFQSQSQPWVPHAQSKAKLGQTQIAAWQGEGSLA